MSLIETLKSRTHAVIDDKGLRKAKSKKKATKRKATKRKAAKKTTKKAVKKSPAKPASSTNPIMGAMLKLRKEVA